MIIEIWHDKYVNSWVVQKKDNNNNQIGKVEYCYSKRESLWSVAQHKKGNSNITIKIFKRDGELQRIE